jgi:hypothetical protein
MLAAGFREPAAGSKKSEARSQYQNTYSANINITRIEML